MPKEKFKNFSAEHRKLTGNKNFSLDTILGFSNSFQTSVLSTLIRFDEVGTHERFSVVSRDNIARRFEKKYRFSELEIQI